MIDVIKEFLVSLSFKVDNSSLNNFNKNVNGASEQVNGLAQNLTDMGIALASAFGGAALFTSIKGMFDLTAEFSKFESVLTILEGSATKAKASLAWVEEFAAATPYGLKDLTDAFVQLRGYGIDPTDGVLRTLGDTASALGKPLSQATAAITDAMMGQNERLTELLIKGEIEGNKIRYTYTNNAGQEIVKLVDKTNKKLIKSTIESIWNEKFGGAMAKMEGSYSNLLSSIGDSYDSLKRRIVSGGAMQTLETALSSIKTAFDQYLKPTNPEISIMSKALDNLLKILLPVGEALAVVAKNALLVISTMINGFGAFNAFTGGLGSAMIAGLALGGVLKMLIGVWGVINGLFMATPIGALITGVMALATAIGLLADDLKIFKAGGESLLNWQWFIDQLGKVKSLMSDISGFFDRPFFMASPVSVSGAGAGAPTTLNQKTEIIVQGSGDPQATANAVAGAQNRTNNDLARNLQGGVR
jgi:hypothetical protein